MSRRYFISIFMALAFSTGLQGISSEQASDDATLFAKLECANLLDPFTTSIKSYVIQNRPEYIALKERVLKDPKVSEAELNLIIIKLLHSFATFRSRIETSRYYDGKLVSQLFLRGVTIWAQNYQDLINANEIFYHAYNPLLNAPISAEQDLDVVYFGARMAWLVQTYDQVKQARMARWGGSDGNGVTINPYYEEDRRKALFGLDKFDETNAREYHIHCNHRNLRVMMDLGGPYVLDRLRDDGIGVPLDPITALKLEFNNGRRANLLQIGIPEKWAARYLGRLFPEEIWIGLGDLSVRQFFPILNEREGYLVRFPRAADFLTVELHPDLDRRIFHIRELKFAAPGTVNVDIAGALEQLQSTWMALVQTFGASEIGRPNLEIVVPARDSKLGDALGNGYRMGTKTAVGMGSSAHQLLKDGKGISIPYLKDSVPVYVRQLSITSAEWKKLIDLDKEMRIGGSTSTDY